MAVNILNLTSLTLDALYDDQPTTSDATLALCPSATTWVATSIVLCNTTASSATITLARVKAGGSSGLKYQVLNAFPVPAHDTITVDTKLYLNTGDFFSGFQGTLGAITMTINAAVLV